MCKRIASMIGRKRNKAMLEKAIVLFIETFKVLKYETAQEMLTSSDVKRKQDFDVTIWTMMIETYVRNSCSGLELIDEEGKGVIV